MHSRVHKRGWPRFGSVTVPRGPREASKCRLRVSIAAPSPSLRGLFWKKNWSPLLWRAGNVGGILRDSLCEGNYESKKLPRGNREPIVWREACRCLAGHSGLGGGTVWAVPESGLNLWHKKDLLASTPSVCQPLFETSDFCQLTPHKEWPSNKGPHPCNDP